MSDMDKLFRDMKKHYRELCARIGATSANESTSEKLKYSDIRLTPTEVRIIGLFVVGKTTPEMAKALGISVRAITRYKKSIRLKNAARAQFQFT